MSKKHGCAYSRKEKLQNVGLLCGTKIQHFGPRLNLLASTAYYMVLTTCHRQLTAEYFEKVYTRYKDERTN